ncbi:DUF3592 domain-containing protein [Cryptosporangium sp. NPDC048952]|uniref:DUF3592 domain-containing protein n=1 Tax=Cryptosporangium sp. NPDC048952 TaxID=3363961 RepID=UPI00371DFFC2
MGVGALLVIIFFIVVFGGLTVRDVLRMRAWPPVAATVVDNVYDPHRGENGGGMYQSVVEFRTHEGRVVRSHDRSWSSRPSCATGSQVTIRYDVQNPERVVVGRKSTVILGSITVVLIAFFVFAVLR